MPEFSIIVPVYNVEKVFRRCLESIVNQTFTDFECILVDDCSPDNCGKICDEYAKKDGRFHVIHKLQNEGLPKARKSGLDVAQGEFVVHADSDDWLELNALELLHKEFADTNADIVWGNNNIVMKNMVIKRTLPSITSEETLLEYFFLNPKTSLWGAGYRKSLFDNYIVPEAYYGEDAITDVQLFSKTNKHKMRVIDSLLYNYDLHNGGASLPKLQKYESFSDCPYGFYVLWIESYLRSINADEKIFDAFNYFICHRSVFLYMRFNSTLKSNEINELYNQYYQPCSHKKKLRLPDKVCLVLLAKCFPLGKTAVLFFNVFAEMSRKIKGM